MEDMARLGDIALKLERYRSYIASALSWVIFGMLFGSLVTLGSSLILLGLFDYRIFWALVAAAGIAGGYVYERFLRMMPVNREIRRRWRVGTVLLFIPFIASYSVIPSIIQVSSLYYNTIWYPSLGFGLLLAGLYAERGRYHVRSATYGGLLILLTSPVVIPVSNLPPSLNFAIGSGLLCVSLMILIYFAVFVYVFFSAQRVIYA